LENVLKIFKFNLHNNTGRFSLAAGDDEIHFSTELIEEFSKWVQGFLLPLDLSSIFVVVPFSFNFVTLRCRKVQRIPEPTVKVPF